MPSKELEWYNGPPWRIAEDGDGCRRLLLLLLYGWGLSPKDWRAPPWPPGGEAWRAQVRRLRLWDRYYKALRLPLISAGDRQRPLHPMDAPETWREAGFEEYVLEGCFPGEGRAAHPRGRPRIDRRVTPDTVGSVVERIEAALGHLYQIPAPALGDHFSSSFGSVWPPRLRELHDLLVDRWRNGYKRRGTALSVAHMLPLRVAVHWRREGGAPSPDPATPPSSAIAEPCSLDLRQLRGLLYRA